MRGILKAEENFSTYREVPVDIERTWIGMSIEPLLMCFMGNNHLFPYTEVSYRVLQRIADVLNSVPQELTYDIDEKIDEKLPALLEYTLQKSMQRNIIENSA